MQAVSDDQPRLSRRGRWGSMLVVALAIAPGASAADWPYFVTYSHRMEEPGNLEIATRSVTAKPKGGNRFAGSVLELEYGIKTWWTSEFYLAGQTTAHDSSVFTGYRWENRFRLLSREHRVNPVLYVEYESINGADRGFLHVVGHDGREDFVESNAEARAERKREIEARLILGSNVGAWNISENFIAEKNLAHEPFEFGYAVAVSRPLGLVASPERCRICRENIRVGAEFYGGLGTHDRFGFRDTSAYLAPTASIDLANGTTIKISPGFGLTSSSIGFLLRVGVSYEISQFGRAAGRCFR